MTRRNREDDFLLAMTEGEVQRAAHQSAAKRRLYASSYAPNSLTTKGDLLTRTATAYERVGVGTDAQVLVADSADAEGMKWRDLFPIPTAVWTDVIGEILPGLTVSAPTVAAYRDTPFLAYHFTHNQDDELSFRFQVPHSFKRATECRLHIHFVPCVNPAVTEYVVWECTYAWAYDGVEVPALVGWTTAEARSTISTTSAFTPIKTPLVATTPTASGKESSILCVRVRRLGSTAPATVGWVDDYLTTKTSPLGSGTANVMLLSCDLHIQVEKLGTANEVP